MLPMLTSQSAAIEWARWVHLWNSVDVSRIELSRTRFPATMIDDTVLTSFFTTQFSDRLTVFPVNFLSMTFHLQVPAEFLLSIHTPCIGIVVPVGGDTNGIDADHYALCVLDRDFKECRLYNSLKGYDDNGTASRVLAWLGYSNYGIFTGISPMQSKNDCGLWVIRNAIFEMGGNRLNVTRDDVVEHVCLSIGITVLSLPNLDVVQAFDEMVARRHVEARTLEQKRALQRAAKARQESL